MPPLSKDPITLTGGCFCSAIRYTITIPSLSSRPKIPPMPSRELHPPTEISSHMPMISLDHCTSCRRAPGSIVECWLIMPQSWITFSLLPKFTDAHLASAEEYIQPTTIGLLKGEEEIIESTWLRHFEGNEGSHRTFCGRCGTHLTFHYSGEPREMSRKADWGAIFDVAVGTLDQESVEVEGLKPNYTGWAELGIGWVKKLLAEGEKSLVD
ncbi:uncharacterized protein LY89DRAFT_688742 [Mollisia scopiformis]|uniref:CENP-V/GFA domain-containing protein n=1 Tax=Mollisia scopiformis TaxID=149040 RepID=A0A194WU68_MOLSC|nr:uncharacterized protein LY89DRAFT_688742 [Mollisia scopiformis]KUJ11506.1 hypothetical protein LY89DRAFT_688742 [Mollisia scopiformis]